MLSVGVSIDLSTASDANGNDVVVSVLNDGTGVVAGDIVAYVDGAEGVFGSANDDVIAGDLGRNILHGGAGGDEVLGGDGQDLLSGGAGADAVYGGSGEDILI